MTAEPIAQNGSWTWWERRRLRFTIAVSVTYAAVTVLGEAGCLGTWDHLGFSLPALLLYAAGDLVFVFFASLYYCAGALSELLVNPSKVEVYRRRAYAVIIGTGIALLPAWILFAILVS